MDNVYDYIITQENSYQTGPVPIIDGWEWSMWEHIKRTVLLKNSQYENSKLGNKPFKNIMRNILKLRYRLEGFDVKDIELFINNAKQYFKSFLIRKYYEKYSRENGVDNLIDAIVESDVDFGGVLVKKPAGRKPEVVDWTTIAFCDQTDLLSSPFAIKHFYSPAQLKDMENKRWKNVDEVIALAKSGKNITTGINGKQAKTPGKYIEVYELVGNMPKSWLAGGEANLEDENSFQEQIHLVTFYKGENDKKIGLTLFSGPIDISKVFKLKVRNPINGRTLGFGGGEELFEPQVWTNYDIIRIRDMLDAASKVVLQSEDSGLAARHPNGLKDLDNLEIIQTAEGKPVSQVNTSPVNLTLFEKSISQWEEHAKSLGSAYDSILGKNPTSGTPFKLQELVTETGQGEHEYEKGKLARFIDEIHRDWIIPDIVREIVDGKEFLSELEPHELQFVADSLVICKANEYIKEEMLSGRLIDEAKKEELKQKASREFLSGGKKKFIKILKDEFKGIEIDVYTNIAGKQKNINELVDKTGNMIKWIMSTYDPQTKTFLALQDPVISGLLNQIAEYSGLNSLDFIPKYQSSYNKPSTDLVAAMEPKNPNAIQDLKNF